MNSRDKLLAYRGLAYVLFYFLIGFFSASSYSDYSTLNFSNLYLIATIIMGGQSLAALRKKNVLNSWGVFAFFLADATLAAFLVRRTGASTSPFLVAYPLLGLAGAVVFSNLLMPLILTLYICLAMIYSIGFGVAIIGNIIAILATSSLGFYLMKALNVSGVALKVSEGARARLENLQKAILANIPSGLISVDTEGRIIQINRVGLRILGLSEESTLNARLSKILPNLDPHLHKLNTLVPNIDSFEEARDRRAIKYQSPTGQELRLGYSIARLKDPVERGPLGTLVVFQDLTEIMQLEESLRVSEKLAAVGKLAAGIAHEIRNPLAGISGSAQLLTVTPSLDDEDKRLLAIIQRESGRLDSLITDFLEYVRPAKPKLDPCDLRSLCAQVRENLRVNAKWQKLACKIDLNAEGATPFVVRSDSNKITQILLNLIFNAGQAGATTVELRLRKASKIQLLVIDNGAGIKPEHQKHLFEPFFTTKEGGTGLGLAVSFKLLESMGARINVRSPAAEFVPKDGTIFIIEFEGENS
jgi:two-component system sensor histidine kinase PilS (NtrC family)